MIARVLLRLCDNLKAVGIEPIGAAGDLVGTDTVRAHDGALQRYIVAGQAAVAGVESGRTRIGLARLDGGDLELLRGGGEAQEQVASVSNHWGPPEIRRR